MRFSANIILKDDQDQVDSISHENGEVLKLDDAKQEVVMKRGDEEVTIDYEDIISFRCNLISNQLFKEESQRKLEAIADEADRED